MSKRASSSLSNWNEPEPGTMSRADLRKLVDLLSDDECTYLLAAVQDTVAGERFWEGDSGLFYNDYVKLRYFRVGSNAPTAPVIDHDSFVPMFVTKAYPSSPKQPLPAPSSVPLPLDQALRRRRSRRTYSDDGIDLSTLSTLLHHSCGVTATVAAYGFAELPLRTFPTHGGLQSPEVYLWARAVAGLHRGLYHYRAADHSLELLQHGDFGARLTAIAYNEQYVGQAAAVLLLTGTHDRLRWKYGERAYRFLCMDAGFLGENVYLVCEGLGLGACAISGFAQDAMEDLLGIDGRNELAVLMLTVGVPVDEATVTSE